MMLTNKHAGGQGAVKIISFSQAVDINHSCI